MINEETAASLVTIDDAIVAVRDAFIALDERRAEVFPVASGTGSDPANRFSVKSGRIDGVGPGVKIGTYWPGNVGRGQVAHASTVLLIDDSTGFPVAVVGASHLTALRTAAVDAVAVDALAPADAGSLTVIGTGHQAFYDAVAISRVRTLTRVAVWGRNPARASELARRLRDEPGLPAQALDLDAALDGAQIVTTVTSSRAPLATPDQLRSVTHISAMGADSPGKQELDIDVVVASRCFADLTDQASTIGELQHAVAAGRLAAPEITPIGAVLTGRAPGRQRADERTLFDSSGTAIQDLASCHLALRTYLSEAP
jgi:ornithine cyclodeaminase